MTKDCYLNSKHSASDAADDEDYTNAIINLIAHILVEIWPWNYLKCAVRGGVQDGNDVQNIDIWTWNIVQMMQLMMGITQMQLSASYVGY